ncbi:MAG TPA: UrcA family protein [Steroidobacteraceae bacterium]|jgi:UrcA family protein|nr:UrcA family protein [Steroidobacteraceae bacterium]
MSYFKSSPRAPRISLALVSLGCLAVSSAAMADGGPHYVARHVTVRYGDLNLSSTAGANTLYLRIVGAARFSCGYEGRSLLEAREWQSCYKTAVADAVAAVNSPNLTVIYNREQPGSTVTAMLRR